MRTPNTKHQTPNTKLKFKHLNILALVFILLLLMNNISYSQTWNTNGNVGIGIGNPTEKLHVVGKTILNGNVLIGNNSLPTSKLVIEGIAYAREFHVNLNNNWPDFVFEEDYRLTPLNEVESYIKKNKHLLGVPAESELKKEGINTSEMLAIPMKKIEELTLYLIELKKENNEIKRTLLKINH